MRTVNAGEVCPSVTSFEPTSNRPALNDRRLIWAARWLVFVATPRLTPSQPDRRKLRLGFQSDASGDGQIENRVRVSSGTSKFGSKGGSQRVELRRSLVQALQWTALVAIGHGQRLRLGGRSERAGPTPRSWRTHR